MPTRSILPLLVLPLATAAQPQAPTPSQSASVAAERCSGSIGATIEGLRITAARLIPAGPAPTGSTGPNGNPRLSNALPAHCLVQGRFEERTGVGGAPYAMAIELRVPFDWNGRLFFQGGGGLNGRVNQAIGRNVSNGSTAPVALARGFAVVTTDSGHADPAAAFADDQQAVLDYAYDSVGKVVRVAKALVADLAGRRPARSYYVGCSNGGREAMLAAQRFPLEFDGVIAGNPAFRIGQASIMYNHAFRTYARIAPPGPDGRPAVPLAFTAADMQVLSRGILKQCDALDGAADGMVFDHAACRFDPKAVQCRPGERTGCLPAAKVANFRAAFAGPPARPGSARPVVPYTYDAGIAADGWRLWQMGAVRPDGSFDMSRSTLVRSALARYLHFPPVDPAYLDTADSATMLAAVAPAAALSEATSTRLTTFAARGGKMMLVTGWSDPVFAPEDLVAWYGQLDRDMTRASGQPAAGFARLYLVPGMNHCGGGAALDDFDALTSLVDWVENGKAPDFMPMRGDAFPNVSRPLCAFPRVATYRGRGRIEDAGSFACAIPRPAA